MKTEFMAWLDAQLAGDPEMAKAVARRQQEMRHEGRRKGRRQGLPATTTSVVEVAVPLDSWFDVRGDRGFLKAVVSG